MDWEKYDYETEQQLEALRNTLPWDTLSQAFESSSIVGALEMCRMIDKDILKDLLVMTQKEQGKRLRYKPNKKRKFKKWNNEKTIYNPNSKQTT